jgi:antitoxin ParD1/3/4
MHISLTPELESLIKNKVESGLYNNASEVIREALRFMEMNQDIVVQMKLDRLRVHLQTGENEIASGQGSALKNKEEISSFFDGIRS